MSKTRDIPTIALEERRAPDLTKEERIDQVLSDSPPLTEEDYPIIGEQILRLLIAQVKGKINLPPLDLRLSEKIFSKLVPDAPKRVEVKTSIRPEEYIAKAMAENPESFKRLIEHSKQWGEEVEAINSQFYQIIAEEL